MRPYYEAGGVTLYHGDCREILPGLSADAVITDPPFGISHGSLTRRNVTGKRTGTTNTWHPPSPWDRELDPSIPPLCLAVAPVVAWFGHWRMRHTVEQHFGMPARAEIVWAKNCHMGPPCPVARRDERIWLFSAAGITCKRFDTSVWDEPIIPTWAHRRHRNEKPVSLMTRLVALLVTPGQSIIDPFAGSGSTLEAARDLGVRAIGIELEERYCEVAAKRLEEGLRRAG